MKGIRFFILSAGSILLAAALGRFAIAAGNAPALALPEPLLGVPLRSAVLLVGGLELVVALICLFGKRAGLQIGWLVWLATDFIVYRIGLYWMQTHPQASCIGSLTDPLRLSGGLTGLVVEALPAYLAVGSCASLLWVWLAEPALARRRKEELDSLKMSCPACGRHIRFAVQNLGQTVPCPQCKTAVTLRKPGTLKSECYFCKGHVEFPAHAIGEKIHCPHCKMHITLMDIAVKQPA